MVRKYQLSDVEVILLLYFAIGSPWESI